MPAPELDTRDTSSGVTRYWGAKRGATGGDTSRIPVDSHGQSGARNPGGTGPREPASSGSAYPCLKRTLRVFSAAPKRTNVRFGAASGSRTQLPSNTEAGTR